MCRGGEGGGGGRGGREAYGKRRGGYDTEVVVFFVSIMAAKKRVAIWEATKALDHIMISAMRKKKEENDDRKESY